MTPELFRKITKVAFFGVAADRSDQSPPSEEVPEDAPGKDFPNESMDRSAISPEILARIKAHVEEHKLIEQYGLDHGTSYEEKISQPSFNHPKPADDLEKESAKKKIYRYIKGKRRAWYVDEDLHKKAEFSWSPEEKKEDVLRRYASYMKKQQPGFVGFTVPKNWTPKQPPIKKHQLPKK
jgi:hypothetical protein